MQILARILKKHMNETIVGVDTGQECRYGVLARCTPKPERGVCRLVRPRFKAQEGDQVMTVNHCNVSSRYTLVAGAAACICSINTAITDSPAEINTLKNEAFVAIHLGKCV